MVLSISWEFCGFLFRTLLHKYFVFIISKVKNLSGNKLNLQYRVVIWFLTNQICVPKFVPKYVLKGKVFFLWKVKKTLFFCSDEQSIVYTTSRFHNFFCKHKNFKWRWGSKCWAMSGLIKKLKIVFSRRSLERVFVMVYLILLLYE